MLFTKRESILLDQSVKCSNESRIDVCVDGILWVGDKSYPSYVGLTGRCYCKPFMGGSILLCDFDTKFVCLSMNEDFSLFYYIICFNLGTSKQDHLIY